MVRGPGNDEHRTLGVPLMPMTAESFAPYGEVFGAEDMGPRRRLLPTGFQHQGRVTLGVILQPGEGTRFTRLERHFAITQAFVALSGGPSVVCVAPPGNSEDPASVPDPASVRGFLIQPGQGYLFHRGTWHSLDRYVLDSAGASFLIINADPNPTQVIDYATGEVQMHDNLDVSAPRILSPMRHRGLEFMVSG